MAKNERGFKTAAFSALLLILASGAVQAQSYPTRPVRILVPTSPGGGNDFVALAVTSPQRSPVAPEVPTLSELGVKGVEAPSWYSIVAPAATPRPIVDRLHGELVSISGTADFRKIMLRQALEPTSMTPEQFATFLRGEYDKWGRIIKSLKIQ